MCVCCNLIVAVCMRVSIFKVTVWQLFVGLIDQRERLLCFYTVYCTVFKCSSHYFGISLAGSSLDVHQGINNTIRVCVRVCVRNCI